MQGVRAIVIAEFGPPDVLKASDVPAPVVSDGHVLIDVEVVNVTFVETQIRGGRAPVAAMLPELPTIPGNGVGGVVAECGTGIDPGWIGKRVVSSTGGTGAYAERVAVPASALLDVPDGLAMRDAVALLADGRTALGLLARAEVRTEEAVLVEAAGGGVGSLLVQLAADAGARVIAAAGGERKLELAQELGASQTVDYTRPRWTSSIDGVDVVFDGVGGEVGRAAFELLRPGGRHCAFGMASGSFVRVDEGEARAREVRLVRGAAPSSEELAALTREALRRGASGRLRPIIGQMFPLERAADAHRAIEARTTIGKTLLLVRE
jgi:NADPH:quinone reductase